MMIIILKKKLNNYDIIEKFILNNDKIKFNELFNEIKKLELKINENEKLKLELKNKINKNEKLKLENEYENFKLYFY